MLSFVGTTLEVYPIMQKINHTTRAYICNEKGLKGFLEAGSFTAFVMRKSVKGELDELAGNVKVDTVKLLHNRTVDEAKMHARKNLPGLYIAYMKYFQDFKDVKKTT